MNMKNVPFLTREELFIVFLLYVHDEHVCFGHKDYSFGLNSDILKRNLSPPHRRGLNGLGSPLGEYELYSELQK